ncbi:MAG: L-histidine N(alpha)-methyltransferase [Burkholderiales bacterium]|nr:L-histidine N(alpha)-methyltransferase [Burkholderiales bacterium]
MSALYEQLHLPSSSFSSFSSFSSLPSSSSPAFAQDVLDGLAHRQRRIPCQWLYDHLGSLLFERITQQPEYYPARTEIAILEQVAGQVAEAAGPHATLIELGSGSARKTPIVLRALDRPAAYVPVDISETFLASTTRTIAAGFPRLKVVPCVADFTRLTSLPPELPAGRRVVFFPGSTIGNLDPAAAEALLTRIGRVVGAGALMVIGIDHTRDPARMVRAYDDAAGVTAAFNKNLLVRINRELRGDFDAEAFHHVARFDSEQRRIEMHLVSARTQRATVLGRAFDFAIGQSIHTENSYKPSPFQFLAMAHRAGWRQEQLWVEGAAGYAVHVLQSVSSPSSSSFSSL